MEQRPDLMLEPDKTCYHWLYASLNERSTYPGEEAGPGPYSHHLQMHPLDFQIARNGCTTQDRPTQSVCPGTQGRLSLAQLFLLSGSWALQYECICRAFFWLLLRARVCGPSASFIGNLRLLDAVAIDDWSHNKCSRAFKIVETNKGRRAKNATS